MNLHDTQLSESEKLDIVLSCVRHLKCYERYMDSVGSKIRFTDAIDTIEQYIRGLNH